eukprot:scaffold36078_cov69-Cyclotella_meneghiniana.AAC.1
MQPWASGMWRSRARLRMCSSSVMHSEVATISASQELREVRFWRMDFQLIGPPERQMTKPEMLRNLNSSRGVPSGTALPNWPSQQASEKEVRRCTSPGEGGVASV